MKAAVIRTQGAPPQVGEFRDPEPREGAVVIDVTLAAIGPTDLMKANGDTRPYPGVHVVNGEGVGRTPDGRRVYFGHSILPFGALAERTLVSADEVWELPAEVEDEQAAGMIISATGALIALEQARIVPGENCLLVGATGMLGQAALQIMRTMGAGRIVAAGRNMEVLRRIQARGHADVIAQIGNGDDLEALQAAAEGGFDMILDALWGPPAEAAIKTLKMGGRMLSVGRLAGTTITLPLEDLGFRTMAGVGTGIRPAAERRAAFDRIMAMMMAGKLRIDTREYTLEQIPQAWEALRRSANVKLLVRP